MQNLSHRVCCIILCILATVAPEACAQHYHFDFNLRFGGLVTVDPKDKELLDADQEHFFRTPALNVSTEILFFPIPHVGIGGFYSLSSATGRYDIRERHSSVEVTSFDYAFEYYGITTQAGTSRNKGFQLYGLLRAGKYVMDYSYIELQDAGTRSGFGISAGFGLVAGLSKTVRLNIVELTYTRLPAELSISQVNVGRWVQVQSGLTFKVWRKK